MYIHIPFSRNSFVFFLFFFSTWTSGCCTLSNMLTDKQYSMLGLHHERLPREDKCVQWAHPSERGSLGCINPDITFYIFPLPENVRWLWHFFCLPSIFAILMNPVCETAPADTSEVRIWMRDWWLLDLILQCIQSIFISFITLEIRRTSLLTTV